MSQVSLTGVLFYEGDRERRPLAKSMALQGIEKLIPEVRFPQRGMTFLYGHRNAAVPYILKLGSQSGMDAVVIEVHVEIGKWLQQKVDLSDSEDSGISKTRFLSVSRAKRDVADRITSVWLKHLEPSADPDWPRGATQYPWLLDNLIEEPEFKHLAVIAYKLKIPVPEVGEFQCATIFDLDAIESIDGGWRLLDTEMVLHES